MNKVLRAKPPTWFWFVSVILFLWNAFGVFNYYQTVTMSDDVLAALPAGEQALIAATPSWVTGLFAVAVFSGLLGCCGLILRKTWAKFIFILSFIAVAIRTGWYLVAGNMLAMATPATVGVTAAIVLVAILEIWLANRGIKRGWLR